VEQAQWYVLLLVAATICSCGGARRPPPSPAKHEPAVPAVLRRPGSAEDVLPQAVVSSLRESVQPEFDLASLHSARRVLADQPVWLLAAGGEVCLVRLVYPLVSGRGLPSLVTHECASPSVTAAGSLVVVQSLVTSSSDTPAPARVIGIAPDDISAVTIRCKGAADLRVAVMRNAYEAVVANPVSVDFRVRVNGRLRHTVIPLSTFQGSHLVQR
jgi:hypothetical protein